MAASAASVFAGVSGQAAQLEHAMKLRRAQPVEISAGDGRVGAGLPEEFRRRAEPLAIPVLVCRGELFDAGRHELVGVLVRPRQAGAQEKPDRNSPNHVLIEFYTIADSSPNEIWTCHNSSSASAPTAFCWADELAMSARLG